MCAAPADTKSLNKLVLTYYDYFLARLFVRPPPPFDFLQTLRLIWGYPLN